MVVVGWVSTLVPRGAELEMSHALKGAPSRESPQEQQTPGHRAQAPGATHSPSPILTIQALRGINTSTRSNNVARTVTHPANHILMNVRHLLSGDYTSC